MARTSVSGSRMFVVCPTHVRNTPHEPKENVDGGDHLTRNIMTRFKRYCFNNMLRSYIPRLSSVAGKTESSPFFTMVAKPGAKVVQQLCVHSGQSVCAYHTGQGFQSW
eukprot:686825-Pelagomonas_calceolata.AAC.2